MTDSSEINEAVTDVGEPVDTQGTQAGQQGHAVGADGEVGAGGKETLLEMRQVAGLTAGSVMDLHRGSFQFRESDREVGFSLVVDDVERVSVIAGAAAATVDEIPVVDPTPVGSAVLNVGSACFTVRPPRPEPDPQSLVEWLEAVRRPSKAIAVPPFAGDSRSPAQATSSRFGSLFSKQGDDVEQALDVEAWEFLEAIRDARTLVAERHRHLHPNPEELRSRLERLDPGLWDRTIEHPLFARFAVAYSTIPWEPRFDHPEHIPTYLHRPIQEMSRLPWVPVTANLLFGPLGIVGSRSAALACARNAVLALACTTAPTDIDFSIVTAQGLLDDWNWTSALPNTLFPDGSNNYCVAVADGMTHFDGAGFDHESVKNNEMGLIVLAETLDELPDYCGTIVLVSGDGQCQVTNHLGERVSGTPIGVTADFAMAAATIIREAVGDDDSPKELPDEDAAYGEADRPIPQWAAPSSEDPAGPQPRYNDGPPLDDIVFAEPVVEDIAAPTNPADATLDDLFDEDVAHQQTDGMQDVEDEDDQPLAEPIPLYPAANVVAEVDRGFDEYEDDDDDLDSVAAEIAALNITGPQLDTPVVGDAASDDDLDDADGFDQADGFDSFGDETDPDRPPTTG